MGSKEHVGIENKGPEWYRWDGGWYETNGDKTRYCVWTLNEDSMVLDIGAYHGDWIKRIADKYGCFVYGFEPAPKAFGLAEKTLSGYAKVCLYNFALGKKNGIFPLGDAERSGASFYKNTSPVIQVPMKDVVEVLEEQHIDHIDLTSINIEGGEFDLLPYIIDVGLVHSTDRFMIQWHHILRDASIQEKLAQTHKMLWNHGTWEAWGKRGL